MDILNSLILNPFYFFTSFVFTINFLYIGDLLLHNINYFNYIFFPGDLPKNLPNFENYYYFNDPVSFFHHINDLKCNNIYNNLKCSSVANSKMGIRFTVNNRLVNLMDYIENMKYTPLNWEQFCYYINTAYCNNLTVELYSSIFPHQYTTINNSDPNWFTVYIHDGCNVIQPHPNKTVIMYDKNLDYFKKINLYKPKFKYIYTPWHDLKLILNNL